jgi:hypothetical protein
MAPFEVWDEDELRKTAGLPSLKDGNLEVFVNVPMRSRGDWDPPGTCWVRPIDVVQALSEEQREALRKVLA